MSLKTLQEERQQHLIYGVVALVVGLFFLGPICGIVALVQGDEAKKKGAETGGTIIIWLGMVELIVGGLLWAAVLFA